MLKSVSREVKQLSGAIADSLKVSVGRSGLVYVEEHDSFPGFTRKRSGEHFVYLDAKGAALRDHEAITRIKALAIPPAWTKVWICPMINGHLQVGIFSTFDENRTASELTCERSGRLVNQGR
jgi:DNA topoisomerase I